MKYAITFTAVFFTMAGCNFYLAARDTQLFKAYDACKAFTHHPDCPESWKTKPAFSRP